MNKTIAVLMTLLLAVSSSAFAAGKHHVKHKHGAKPVATKEISNKAAPEKAAKRQAETPVK